MKIVQLTEGGGYRFTSTGIRDQALVSALRRIGHRVTYIRLWDNLQQEDLESWDQPIYFDKTDYALHRYSPLSNILPNGITRHFRDYLATRGLKKISRLTPARKIALNCDCLQFGHHFFHNQYHALSEKLKRIKPDVICLSSLRFAKLIPLMQHDFDCPVVTTLTGSLCNWIRTGILDNPQLNRLLHENLSAADAIISPSNYLAKEAKEFLRLPNNKLKVIHTGFMLNFYGARELIPPHPTICFIGGPSEANGISLFIDALKELDSRGLDFQLIAAGNMTDKDAAMFHKYLKPVFGKRPDDMQVFTEVPISEKTHLFEQTTVLTLPGTQKAFGNPVVEAMASAVPIVVPNAGPYPELFEGSEVGIQFDPTSVDAYADALEKLLTDREFNKSCSQNARKDAINRFSSERMAGEVLELLKTLV